MLRVTCLWLYGLLSCLIISGLCQDSSRTNADADSSIPAGSKDFSKAQTTVKPDKVTDTLDLVCPRKEVPKPFFSLPCTTHKDCRIFGKKVLCCDNSCLTGVKPPKPQIEHNPFLFGFVKQVCPKEPIPEIWDIKECLTDDDCTPRICCPETLKSGENVSYCRIPQPLWEELPGAKQFADPIRGFVGYMQCTPPPPPILDLFPKPCQNPLDCFPNLCCQEGGKRFCRPPKRSILALIADVGQRIIPSEAAAEFIKRIS